jgi:small conductance mechanosensitive channel
MEAALDRLLQATVLFTPRLLASLGILLGFWIVAIALQGIIMRIAVLRRVPREVTTMMRQTVKAGMLALGVVTALGTSGFNVTGLVAGLGLTGLVIGFGLKDALANVVAGALILGYRPFHIDDRISLAGFEGAVIDIDLRYTTLHAGDRRILVPNSIVLTNAISVLEAAEPVRARGR